MITIHTCIYSPYGYNKEVRIDLDFPAIPKIGDYISLTDVMEQILIAGILKDKKNLETYRNMIFGNILSIDGCKFVKEIEWHPKENSNVMEPYVFLYVTNEEEVPMPEMRTITDEDYRLIKEATFKAYGISNAKMFLDKLLLRKA